MKKIAAALLLCVLVFPVKAADYVALSFDDGPSGDNTAALMQVLEEKGVKATFFLCGYRMELYPDTTKALSEAGHELGLHGYQHVCMDGLSQEELTNEIKDVWIEKLTGQHPTLLRPPCGAFNEQVCAEAKRQGMKVILWSVDPEDWKYPDKGKIVRHVCDNTRPGRIILLHDLYPATVAATGEIIDNLRAKGYQFVTVSELAEKYQTPMEPGIMYREFYP